MQNLNFETIKQFFIIKWKLLSVLGIVVLGSVIALLNVDKSPLPVEFAKIVLLKVSRHP
jgi:hypothetical protein